MTSSYWTYTKIEEKKISIREKSNISIAVPYKLTKLTIPRFGCINIIYPNYTVHHYLVLHKEV